LLKAGAEHVLHDFSELYNTQSQTATNAEQNIKANNT
jgi:hypothetical protein